LTSPGRRNEKERRPDRCDRAANVSVGLSFPDAAGVRNRLAFTTG